MISVIIPVYNPHLERFEKCINSVAGKGEIIIVDDASPDKSWESFVTDDMVVVRHDTNLGQGLARETGMIRATGEWITFLDQDDEMILDNVEDEIVLSGCTYLYSTKMMIATDYYWMQTGAYKLSSDSSLLHGKFFNREAVMKYDIHFHPEIAKAEDTYFMSVAYGIAYEEIKNDINAFKDSDLLTYKWYLWEDSTSHSYYGERDYFEYSMDDFIQAIIESTELIHRRYNDSIYRNTKYIKACLMLVSCVDYYTYAKGECTFVDDVQRFIDHVCSLMGINRGRIYEAIMATPKMFMDVYNDTYERQGEYIPQINLREFMRV